MREYPFVIIAMRAKFAVLLIFIHVLVLVRGGSTEKKKEASEIGHGKEPFVDKLKRALDTPKLDERLIQAMIKHQDEWGRSKERG